MKTIHDIKFAMINKFHNLQIPNVNANVINMVALFAICFSLSIHML